METKHVGGPEGGEEWRMSSETEFPPSMGKVAPRELAAHGMTRYDQVAERSERELLAIHGVGPKAIRILREGLESRGLSFRDERG